MSAATLLRQGIPEAEVARRVGVHRQSVNRWARDLRESGVRGLRKAGRAGRKPKLSAQDLRRIERGLKAGPEGLGYEAGLWTTARVGELICLETGVRFSTSHVWTVLRRLGWSCQRPVGRALERDEPAIMRWKKTRWPQLKKKPATRATRSSSSTRAG
jgi:transposase